MNGKALALGGLMVLMAGVICRSAGTTRPALGVGERRVGVVIEGGHETDGRDGGRPVGLVAAGLGVPSEVFREVFRGVRPAHGRGPTGEEARKNKQVLLAGLGKYGVTNERLDEVSNYYRYRPQEGEMWRHREAEVEAVVKEGRVVRFEILDGGAGYSSVPSIKVEGVEGRFVGVVGYGKELGRNGEITGIVVEGEK